jgi:hypothetical protein
MEERRPKVDAAVLAFALSETFSGADFVIRLDGVVRLAPQLARRVCYIHPSRSTPAVPTLLSAYTPAGNKWAGQEWVTASFPGVTVHVVFQLARGNA